MSGQDITFGFSPCPNDTFSFHALVHGLVDSGGFEVRPFLVDVEELNRRALGAEMEMSKLSFHALGHVLERYALLRSGAALGRGCGPLVVTRPGFDLARLRDVTVAVPGRFTTAHLLLSLYLDAVPRVEHMVFDQVMPAVANGGFQAGVIIHEGRFTFQEHGLEAPLDLGQWWEETTGLPIPLGCIAARRDLGQAAIARLQDALAASVRYALANPTASQEYVREHAQEMDPEVTARHIGLYVNDYSLDMGAEGLAATVELMERARAIGMLPGFDPALLRIS